MILKILQGLHLLQLQRFVVLISHRSQDDINMKHKAEHLDELFFLSRPDLFFGSIQIIILPISLYFAMWIVNFSAVHITSGWKVRKLL